jgi:hypothetical protein
MENDPKDPKTFLRRITMKTPKPATKPFPKKQPGSSGIEEQAAKASETGSPAPKKRNPGGQPGNHNALRHGIYANLFTSAENKGLDSELKGEFEDEIALLTILIKRTFESMDPSQMRSDENINALRTITQAIARKESLRRSQRVLYQSQTTIEQILEELAFIPPEQDYPSQYSTLPATTTVATPTPEMETPASVSPETEPPAPAPLDIEKLDTGTPHA